MLHQVALCGDRGRTDDIWLDEAKNHKVIFQKGQEDIFEVETFYVGPVRKIQLGHDSNVIGKYMYLSPWKYVMWYL